MHNILSQVNVTEMVSKAGTGSCAVASASKHGNQVSSEDGIFCVDDRHKRFF